MPRTQFDKLTWEYGGSGIPILRSLCVLLYTCPAFRVFCVFRG
jgi:hypothetical protein